MTASYRCHAQRSMAPIHGSSMSIFLIYRQHGQGQMANFPAFIASKSVFELMSDSLTTIYVEPQKLRQRKSLMFLNNQGQLKSFLSQLFLNFWLSNLCNFRIELSMSDHSAEPAWPARHLSFAMTCFCTNQRKKVVGKRRKKEKYVATCYFFSIFLSFFLHARKFILFLSSLVFVCSSKQQFSNDFFLNIAMTILNCGFRSTDLVHVVHNNLISILVTDYIQKRRDQALFFSFEYTVRP